MWGEGKMLSESIGREGGECYPQGPRMGMPSGKGLAFRLFISLQESLGFVLKKPMVNGEVPSSHQERFCAVGKTPMSFNSAGLVRGKWPLGFLLS